VANLTEQRFEAFAKDLLAVINKEFSDDSSESAQFAGALLKLIDGVLMGKITIEQVIAALDAIKPAAPAKSKHGDYMSPGLDCPEFPPG